jgi:hypothetical protein
MDGAPAKGMPCRAAPWWCVVFDLHTRTHAALHCTAGDTVGIRVFLKRLHLQPTMRDVCKRFSVRWFLNFCLYDEFGRRYFKQHEVTIWRRDKP